MFYFYPFSFRPYPQSNYRNNQRNNRGNFQNNCHRQVPPPPPPCPVKRDPEPVCCPGPCYNEADYKVSCLEEMLTRYRCLIDQAEVAFGSALCDLRKVSESLTCGLTKTEEAARLWCEIVCWLDRYYKRYGNYCECEQLLAQYDALFKEINCLEREALEAVCTAIHKLEESKCKKALTTELLFRIMTQCVPKC